MNGGSITHEAADVPRDVASFDDLVEFLLTTSAARAFQALGGRRCSWMDVCVDLHFGPADRHVREPTFSVRFAFDMRTFPSRRYIASFAEPGTPTRKGFTLKMHAALDADSGADATRYASMFPDVVVERLANLLQHANLSLRSVTRPM